MKGPGEWGDSEETIQENSDETIFIGRVRFFTAFKFSRCFKIFKTTINGESLPGFPGIKKTQ